MNESPRMRSNKCFTSSRVALAVGLAVILGAILVLNLFPTSYEPAGSFSISLVAWLVPSLVLFAWLRFQQIVDLGLRLRAARLTLAIVIAMCLVMEVFFAHQFFQYPNQDAVVGIYLPGIDLFQFTLKYDEPFPVEDLLFYVVGCLWILSLYLWLGVIFHSGWKDSRAKSLRTRKRDWAIVYARSLLISGGFILIPIVLTQWLTSSPIRLPKYLVSQIFVAIAPAMSLASFINYAVNWRSLVPTVVLTVLMSAAYEVRWALPSQWWAYRPESLLGLNVNVGSPVPVEAVSYWILATFFTVYCFEIVFLWLENRTDVDC